MYVRCFGTYANYLGHLRGACLALGHEPPPVGHPAIRRAMVAITKRELFCSKERRFIDKACVTNMVLAVQKAKEDMGFAMLWLISYSFLLRLPSEA